MTTLTVLREVLAERRQQDTKFGEQNHPDGTGPEHVWAFTGPAAYVADCARTECQRLFKEGYGTWLAVLREELAEAFAESDPVKLRDELVQVAAVAVNWVESIDRRNGPPPAPAATQHHRGNQGRAAGMVRAVELLTTCPICGSTAVVGCTRSGVGNVPGYRHPELAARLDEALQTIINGTRDLP